MKRLFGQRITLLSLMTWSISVSLPAQTIEIRSGAAFINSQKISRSTTSEHLQKILGKANRISKKADVSTIMTYDDLGLRIYVNPTTQLVESVELDLVKRDFDFSPKNIFHGTYMINGNGIDRSTSIQALTQLKGIGFHHTVLDLYTGTSADLTLTFQISDDTHRIEEIATSFTSP